MKRYYVFDSTHSPCTTDHTDQAEAFNDFISRERTADSYIALGIYKGMGACDILMYLKDGITVSEDHTKLHNFQGAEELTIIEELKTLASNHIKLSSLCADIEGKTIEEVRTQGYEVTHQVEGGTCAYIVSSDKVNLIAIDHDGVLKIDYDSDIVLL